ncbi:MAG TPA: histidine kinase dimerization/phospho-acceptor domain-containing protein, partial [Xanthomonadales bacterium]|nr:histidine kinase dimerization/phospho-acceptor domain-containing protein [Xanthomonadales bacterium]
MTLRDAETDALFAGGGELGALMRAHDWNATPLGPPERWPRSLRTALRILLTSRQPFWLGWGPDLTYFYNDPYKSIIGGKHPWALGKPFADVWREIFDVVGPMAAHVMARDEGTYVEAQRLIMERNGYPEETYYTFSYSPVPGDDGRVAGLICANTDDTRRVIGERQLATLRELGARAGKAPDVAGACRMALAALATNACDVPFAAIRLDGDDGELLAFDSHAALASLELPPPGRTDGVHVVDAPAIALPTGEWPVPPRRMAIAPIGGAGSARAGVLAIGLSPYRLFDKSYAGFVELVAREIAGSIAHADAFAQERRRAEALAALDRAKTAFFSNISHEFRTPLTLMLGPLEELLGDASADDGDRRALALVHRNARRLLKLVNTLLDFSRVEAGRATPQLRAVDLAQLTAALAETFRPLMERGGLRFEVDCAPLSRPVAVDREQWEKIVFNLLSNAFKFTIEGGVAVRLREQAGQAVLEVSDTGAGIAATELPRLFERFHRVRDARGRSFEGTGIGLALVRELVAAHGGEVDVASEPGRGSTFAVRLPLASTDAVPAADGATVAHSAGAWLAELDEAPVAKDAATTDGPRPRVLVVDDNADMRAYLKQLLAPRYELDEAADGEAALAAIAARVPDLVLSDVMMPRLDGAGLVAAIRANAALHLVPVILLSARAGEEAQVEGMQTGADDYLVKPFSARELLARVSAHLSLARLRRELVAKESRLRQEAEQAWARVRESEERFRSFTDTAPAMLWTTAPDGACTFVSAGWQEFTGQRPSQALGFGWLDAMHPEDRPVVREQFLAANTRRQAFELDFRVRRPNGLERWVLATGRPRFAPDGAFQGYIGSVIDVHERREAELALREADRRKTEFLATLAHELRNPLAPLANGLEVLARAKGAAHAVQQLLPPMERQLRHLVRLVDDLLEVARITRGAIELRRGIVDLLPIVRNALETSRPLIDAGRHTLELRID